MSVDRTRLGGRGAARHEQAGARAVFAAASIVVAAAAIAEALNALGVVDNGDAPGADYRFRGLLIVSAVLVMLVIGLSAPVIALSRRLARNAAAPVTILFILAAASLCAARYFAYDAYDAPSRIRFGDSDAFSPSFVILAVALDLAAAALLPRSPRPAFAVLFPGLVLSAFYVFAAGLGH